MRFVALRGRVGAAWDWERDCDCDCDCDWDFDGVVVAAADEDDDDGAAVDGLAGDVDEVFAAAGFAVVDEVFGLETEDDDVVAVVFVFVGVASDAELWELLLLLVLAFAFEARLREGIVGGVRSRGGARLRGSCSEL